MPSLTVILGVLKPHPRFTAVAFAAALISIFKLPSPVEAQVTGWVGLTYVDGNAVLNELNPNGSVAFKLGNVSLGPDERPNVNAFRCVPDGTNCFFPTESPLGAFLYNLTIDGDLIQRVSLGNVRAHNCHAQTAWEPAAPSGAYILALDPVTGGAPAAILRISNNVVSTVLDLSDYFPQGTTSLPGSTTQCSNNGNLWIAVSDTARAANAVLLQVNLGTKTVVSSLPLQFSGFSSLWAQCDDRTGVNTLGGIMLQVSAASRALVYGTVDSAGAFTPGPTVPLPTSSPTLAPTGLLSMPLNYAMFAALYPVGTLVNSTATGMLAFTNMDSSGWTLTPISYNLIGAGRWK